MIQAAIRRGLGTARTGGVTVEPGVASSSRHRRSNRTGGDGAAASTDSFSATSFRRRQSGRPGRSRWRCRWREWNSSPGWGAIRRADRRPDGARRRRRGTSQHRVRTIRAGTACGRAHAVESQSAHGFDPRSDAPSRWTRKRSSSSRTSTRWPTSVLPVRDSRARASIIRRSSTRRGPLRCPRCAKSEATPHALGGRAIRRRLLPRGGRRCCPRCARSAAVGCGPGDTCAELPDRSGKSGNGDEPPTHR
ncbi:hypothetical protein ABIA38_005569 [Embleya sp. AB8]